MFHTTFLVCPSFTLLMILHIFVYWKRVCVCVRPIQFLHQILICHYFSFIYLLTWHTEQVASNCFSCLAELQYSNKLIFTDEFTSNCGDIKLQFLGKKSATASKIMCKLVYTLKISSEMDGIVEMEMDWIFFWHVDAEHIYLSTAKQNCLLGWFNLKDTTRWI